VVTERVVEIPWALAQLPRNGRILDIGSCEANYHRSILTPGRELHCLDPRDCRSGLPDEAVFHHQSLIGSDLPRGAFDAVLLLSTIEHIGLPCYEQVPFEDGDRLALAEVWELLRPGGLAVVTVPAGSSKVASWYRQYSAADLRRLFDGWSCEIRYWGFDGSWYEPISEAELEGLDYREIFMEGAGAGAVAGIRAVRPVR
jgi:SAM-dependent methyltransferase